jgi:hypothetical protein
VAAVLAALVLLALAFDSRDSPNSTGGASREALEDPRNATEEIATRSPWRDPPQLFAQAEDTLSYEGDGNGPYIGQVVATDSFGNVQAYDPEGLAQAGASIQGLPVILVGRVVTDTSQRSEFDVTREVRVVGENRSFDAYIGTDNLGAFPAGTVVYAIGRLAAVGPTETPDGAKLQSSYFLATLNNNGGEVREVAFDAASRAVLVIAKPLRR